MIESGTPLSKNGRAALNYASRGLFVFPCHHISRDGSCSCGKECASPGKHPRVLDWENAATTDEAQIRAWWMQFPLANIGCATGRTGWIVVDSDPRNGGDEALHDLTTRYGAYVTARSLTGGGGTHDVFSLPQKTTFRSRSTAFGASYPGVDVKSAGGYVLLPPSNHKSGQRYHWEADTPEIAVFPDRWAMALKKAERANERAGIVGVDNDELITDGTRHTVFVAFAGRMRRSGMGLPAIEHAIRALNAQQCEHPMDEPELALEIKGILGSAGRDWSVVEPLPHGLDRDLKPRSAVGASEIKWDDARPWPTLDDRAFYGLAGEIVKALEPQTEADPAAMLFTLLAAVGNMHGHAYRSRVQDDEHPARLYVAIVGDTSSGAKGTSYATLRPILKAAESAWFETRLLNGFGSGEAIIAELVPREEAPLDPRLFVVEPEFARLLAINARDGSTQSMILRAAWDGHPLAVRRSKDRIVAKDSHISIVAHVTPSELRARLTETDATSGFANRFFFVLSRRSKKLPSGGYISPAIVGGYAKRLAELLTSRAPRELRRSPAAERLWAELYHAEQDRDGLVGALTARAHAQKLRLAVAYAALDGAQEIEVEHLYAAQACWSYSVATVQHLFGSLRGDNVQDRLLDALRDAYPGGLTGAEQDALFSKNLAGGRLKLAREELERRGLIKIDKKSASEKGGRPSITAFAVPLPPPTEERESTEKPADDELVRANPFYPCVSEENGSQRNGASRRGDSLVDEPGEDL